MIQFILNNETISTHEPPGNTLVDFIRYHTRLTGTKIGCREGDCGACTVLVGSIKNNQLQYRSLTSCLTAIGNVRNMHVVTVEGINQTDGMNPVQQAMANESATQCGFCTPGFIVSMTGFCLGEHMASYEQAVKSVDGNICRCTGYKSIERALRTVVEMMQQKPPDTDTITYLTGNGTLPAYFNSIRQRLQQLSLPANGNGQPIAATVFLGGGTDLYVQQHEKMVESQIDFLLNNAALKGIHQQDQLCIIGASTTVTELMESKIFKDAVPGFNRFAELVSSTPIRNIATLAGNFSNASPIGDLTILFLALNATLQLREGNATRQVPLQQFYKGYKQMDKGQHEYIEKILLPLPSGRYLVNFEKVSKRRNLDIASVNTAIQLAVDGNTILNGFIAAGGVAAVPFYLKHTSGLLAGKKIDEDLVEMIVAAAQQEVTPISDARGSASYKKQLLGQLIKAHFIELFPGLNVQKLMGLHMAP